MSAPQFDLPTGNAGMAPFTVHVDAIALADFYTPGKQVECIFEWNFGDPGSRFNELPGFVAAHQYRRPGQYTITLKMSYPDGTHRIFTQKVSVAADTRKKLYVSHSQGNDANPGTKERPISTFAEAGRRLESNLTVMFERGGTYDTHAGWHFPENLENLHVTTYGGGKGQRAKVHGLASKAGSFTLFDPIRNNKAITIEELEVDSDLRTTNKSPKVSVARAGLLNTTLRDLEIHYVDSVLNGNTKGRGQLVQDCLQFGERSLASYFQWAEGDNIVTLGNRCLNSTREHVIRVGGNPLGMLIYGNDLEQRDFRDINGDGDSDDEGEDRSDYQKGVLTIQRVRYGWVANNRIAGPSNVGPLGNNNTEPREKRPYDVKSDRARIVVVEDNLIQGFFRVDHGSENVRVRRNFIVNQEENGKVYEEAAVINVQDWTPLAERGVKDLVIENNTLVRAGKHGAILHVDGKGWNDDSTQVTIRNNVFYGKDMYAEGWGTAVLVLPEIGVRVEKNTIPVIRSNSWANGIIGIGGTGDAEQYRTAEEFEKYEWAVGNSYVPVADHPPLPALPIADTRRTIYTYGSAPVTQRPGTKHAIIPMPEPQSSEPTVPPIVPPTPPAPPTPPTVNPVAERVAALAESAKELQKFANAVETFGDLLTEDLGKVDAAAAAVFRDHVVGVESYGDWVKVKAKEFMDRLAALQDALAKSGS